MAHIMPAALSVDWSAVKTHCVAHGIPDAAQRYGITQEAIRQRCHREGWKNDPAIAEALVRGVTVSRPVLKHPAKIMVESVKDKLLRTRANHVETALIVSADMLSLAEEKPSAFRDKDLAGVLVATGKHAALTGGWQEQSVTPKVNLGLTGNASPRTLEAEAIQDGEFTEMPASTDLADY